ncbi:MAG: FKBP-type peptidyl-prolyl cis-trans isomerase [Porticoccus sp.]|nr:FKBP-type peptidyl-prolyl cis-trans isomerase [Porticoccus sp.]
MDSLPIGPDTKITLHFSLSLENGSLVDSNFEADPAICTFGDGSLLPGFEAVLIGLKSGAEEIFSIQPEKGFGQHNPSNIQQFARKEFDEELDVEPGLMLSFADANRAELPGVVVEVDEETVTIDFNHPLAGHTISFKVKILSVVPAVTH